MLNLDTELVSIIPGIRNGFASAVNQSTGDVYLGGSDGIFKHNCNTNNIDQRHFVNGVDVFDMYFNGSIYFTDTATQNLHYLNKYRQNCLISYLKGNLIQHFVYDINNDLYYVNYSGVCVLTKGSKSPMLFERNVLNIRGAAVDASGLPLFVAKDGIYEINKVRKNLSRILTLENGYGLAFDKNNNIIYSEERSVFALIPY